MAKKSSKRKTAPGPQTVDPSGEIPSGATQVAVPLVVYGAVLKVLETLPYSTVSPIMGALQQCQPISVPVGSKPGQLAEGLQRAK